MHWIEGWVVPEQFECFEEDKGLFLLLGIIP
jgi:hypothetical protein